LVAIFVKSFSMKPWNARFGIFPRYTSHIMIPRTGLPFLRIFLNHLWKNFKSWLNSRCPPSVLGRWGT
jgi:hypothetical protein